MKIEPGYVNLFIIGIAIIVVGVLRSCYDMNPDMFVANVPIPPHQKPGYSQPLAPQQAQQFSKISQGSPKVQPQMNMRQPNAQQYYNYGNTPHQFTNQYYPAKYPYANETGSTCVDGSVTNGCGAAGVCQNGVCKPLPYKNTVFGIPTNAH